MPEYIYPAPTHSVSDNFQTHKTRTPPSVNPGTDFRCSYGEPVVADKAGTITALSTDNGGSGGRYIHNDHGDGTASEDLHLSEVLVSIGQYVEQGQQIALSGGSGFGSDHGASDHLHHALKINGINVDFELYVDGGSAPASSAGDASVSNIQSLLNNFGYGLAVDGQAGPATAGAIVDFQTQHGLDADGVVGPITLGVLQAGPPAPAAPAAPSGDQDVINRQNYLNATFGESLTVDGDAGPATQAAIARYQTILGVTADGDWGPATQAAHQAYYDAHHQSAPVAVVAPVAAVVTPEPAVVIPAPVVGTPTPAILLPPKVSIPVIKSDFTAAQIAQIQTAIAGTEDVTKMSLLSVAFFNYASERVIKTFAMSLAAQLSAAGAAVYANSDLGNVIAQIGWQYSLSVSVVAAGASLLVALSSFKNIK